jgi:hypothetical protein
MCAILIIIKHKHNTVMERRKIIKPVGGKLLMHAGHENDDDYDDDDDDDDDDDRPNNNSINFIYWSACQKQRPISGTNTEIRYKWKVRCEDITHTRSGRGT